MATAVLKIDQATLGSGVNDQSRDDGVPSQLVTVTSVGLGGTEFELRFWAVSPGVSVPTLTLIVVGDFANRQWTFNPGAGYGKTYGLELIVNGSSRNPVKTRRRFAIKTQLTQLVIPLFGEEADPTASIQTAGLASVIRDSTANAGANPYGWGPDVQKMAQKIEEVAGGALLTYGVTGEMVGVGDTNDAGVLNKVMRADARLAHGNRGGGALHATAVASSGGAGGSAGFLSAILAEAINTLNSKVLFDEVISADRGSPGATTENVTAAAEFGPFNTVAGVIGDGTVVGIPVLLEGAGAAGAHDFNTTSGRPAPAASPTIYQLQVFDQSGNEVLDGATNRPVWALISTTARTTGGTYTLRFFSGEWGSGAEAAFNLGVGYVLAYAKGYLLTTLPSSATRSRAAVLSKVAAGIAPDSITALEIAAGTITDTEVAAANKDGAAGTASMRTLGTGAQQAKAGNYAPSESEIRTALLALTAPTNFNGQDIVNVGNVDGVDVSGHAARHKHGGADEVATATPGANEIPKAGGGGTLATGWIPVLDIATKLSIASEADGDIIRRASGAWGRLAGGTNGHVLTMVTGVPAWAAPAGGSSTPTPVFSNNSGNLSDLAALMAWLPLGETVGGCYDRLGRVHCAQLGTVARIYGGGPAGEEMVVGDFNNSSNYLENASLDDWWGDLAYSVACWFRIDALPSVNNDFMTIVSRTRTNAAGWALRITRQFGTTYLTFWTNDGSSGQVLAGVTSLAINTWYSAVICQAASSGGSGTKDFYVNGSDEFGANGPYPQVPDSTTRFQIGREAQTGGTGQVQFDGRVCNVALWRNRKLTQAEAQAFHNSGNVSRLRGV